MLDSVEFKTIMGRKMNGEGMILSPLLLSFYFLSSLPSLFINTEFPSHKHLVEFGIMCKSYVDAINKGAVPDLKSAWEK